MPFGQPTLQDIDAQIADLKQRASNSNGRVIYADEWMRQQDQQNALLQQRNALVRSQAQAQSQTAAANPYSSVDSARQRTFGLNEDRLSELRGDPVDAQVMGELQRRVSGEVGPYDQTTKDALFTQQGEMASQIQNNSLAQLRSGGGSASDPSYQSGVNEALAGRQAAMQRANLDINTKANLANYDARTSAVGSLGAFNTQRNAGITDQTRHLSDLYSNIYANHETAPQQPQQPQQPNQGGGDLPNFAAWQAYYAGQNQGAGNNAGQNTGTAAPQPWAANPSITAAREHNAQAAPQPQSTAGQGYYPGMPAGLQGVQRQGTQTYPGMPAGLQGVNPQQYQWKPQF